jgi:putative sigma-54 modulation protein
MQINITARQLDLTPALYDYAQEKIQKVEKYFDHIIDAHIILSIIKYRQIAEVIIHAPGLAIKAREEANDMYAAIDMVIDNLESQIKKHKEKIKAKSRMHRATRKGKIRTESGENVTENIIGESIPKEEIVVINETKKIELKPMSLGEAFNQMKVMKHNKWVFLNSDTSKINFIYKKDDGDYGIIEVN